MIVVFEVRFLQYKVADACGQNKFLTSPILAKQDYKLYTLGCCVAQDHHLLLLQMKINLRSGPV